MTPQMATVAYLATAESDPDDVLICPECGSEALGTVEILEGVAGAKMFRTTGQAGPRIDHSGSTDVNWNSSTTVGVQCRACYWECREPNWASKLRVQAEA